MVNFKSLKVSPDSLCGVRHHNREVLTQLLAQTNVSQRPLRLSAAFQSARQLLRAANVIGIGFGAKETKQAFTGDLAIRLYVNKKLGRRNLSVRQRLPEFINGMLTDVIPIGGLRLQARPVALAASISHVSGKAGSLGCIVSRSADEAWFILSASHVLSPNGVATPGDQIVEPAAPDGSATPIATLTDFEPLQPDGVPNRFDAAIARVNRKADIEPVLPVIGQVRSAVMEPVLFQSVRKYGAGTGHTLGVVTDVAAETTFTFDGEEYLFQNVVQITGCGEGDFSVGGDSGALVVDALSSSPIGLIIGGAGPRTFVSPLRPILDRFDAQIVT